jgi:uncharacterized protein (TIRG00374 family)
VKYFQILLGVAISLASGYYAFHGIEWKKVETAFSRLDVMSLLPAVGALALLMLLRAYRWKLFVAPVQAVPLRSFWSATLIGFMANDLLPLRAGEFVRAYALAHITLVRVSTAVATTVLERVWDAVAVAVLLVVTLSGFPLPPWLRNANFVLLGMCGVVLIGGWAVVRMGEGAFARLSPRFAAIARNFVSGFSMLQNIPLMLWVLVLSLLIWLTLTGFYLLLFHACGLDLPLRAAFVVMIFTVFAAAIPAAPGYLGTFQVAMELALRFFSVPKEEALGFSLVAHITQILPVVIVGLIELFRARLPLWPSQLRKEELE